MEPCPDRQPPSPEDFYQAGIEWAHGGPPTLNGGCLRRYQKTGADSGGIFLTRSEPEQIRYAVGYSRGGLYRVQVDLQPDEVFNLGNPEHLDRIRDIETEDGTGQDLLWTIEQGDGSRLGALDWASVDEGVLAAAGFRAAVLAERPPGVVGGEPIYSLVVFDEKAVRVVGQYPPETIHRIRAETLRYCAERDAAEKASAVVDPAEQLQRLLRYGFNEAGDQRFESGDCESFAVALADRLCERGEHARVLYGYRDPVPELDGDDASTMPAQFSHAVVAVAYPDGSEDTFDYRGKDAIGRWEQRFTPTKSFADVRTGAQVTGLSFAFRWDENRTPECHPRPAPRPDRDVMTRLESLFSRLDGMAAASLSEESLQMPRTLRSPVSPRMGAAAATPALDV